MTDENNTSGAANHNWPRDVFAAIKTAGISQVATVPDGGLIALLQNCVDDPEITVVTLTTEEEGVAFCCGAWLAGKRSALLLQSSGVGNLINMLSLPQTCRIPLLMLVTMRGEWNEFNPWQAPMGLATTDVLETMQVTCHRPQTAGEIGETFAAAANHVFSSGTAAAILVSQRIIGAKEF